MSFSQFCFLFIFMVCEEETLFSLSSSDLIGLQYKEAVLKEYLSLYLSLDLKALESNHIEILADL